MEQEEKKHQESADAAKSFSFLSSIQKGQDLTVRDDLLDFQLLLDSAKLSRRKRIPFRIVDSGSRDVIQLEWLAAEGATIYTSDDAKRELAALQQINKACKQSNSFLAYLHNGHLNQESFIILKHLNLAADSLLVKGLIRVVLNLKLCKFN